jgi:hypothetical protein
MKSLMEICTDIDNFQKEITGLKQTNAVLYDQAFPSTLSDNLLDFSQDFSVNAAKFNQHTKWLTTTDGVINDRDINKSALQDIGSRLTAQVKTFQTKLGENTAAKELLAGLDTLSQTLANQANPTPPPRRL